MMNKDTAYIILSILQEMLPFYILFLSSLKDRLRFSNWINIPVILFYMILTVYLTSRYFIDQGSITVPLFPFSLSFMAIAVLLCCVFIKGRHIINIFILFIIRSYLDIIYMFVKSVDMFHFIPAGHTRLEGIILSKALLTLITFPLVYLFIRKLLKPSMNDTESSLLWKWIWFIPLLFYLCFYAIINPAYQSHQNVSLYAASVLPFFWIFTTFLTYYLILRLMREAIIFAQIKESLRLSEIQTAIQRQQYEELRQSIEKAKAARHDMRHILLVLDGYLEKGDLDAFQDYIHKYKKEHPLDQ